MFDGINYLAVIVAAVAAMILGYLWYSDFLFGKRWKILAGITKKDEAKMKKRSSIAIIFTFISLLITAFVLEFFIKSLTITTYLEAAALGVLMWFGFTATNSLGRVLWEKGTVDIFILNNIYNVLQYILIALVLFFM